MRHLGRPALCRYADGYSAVAQTSGTEVQNTDGSLYWWGGCLEKQINWSGGIIYYSVFIMHMQAAFQPSFSLVELPALSRRSHFDLTESSIDGKSFAAQVSAVYANQVLT